MSMMIRVILLLLAVHFMTSAVFAGEAETPLAPDPQNTLYLDLSFGRVVIRMRPDLAPQHVARIKHLVRGGFYDGLTFHRVISGFVAQAGDLLENGSIGTG